MDSFPLDSDQLDTVPYIWEDKLLNIQLDRVVYEEIR